MSQHNAASQQKTSCMLHPRRPFSGSQTALRRTAFLDVSSLNFGGAKSTAVFFCVQAGDRTRPCPIDGILSGLIILGRFVTAGGQDNELPVPDTTLRDHVIREVPYLAKATSSNGHFHAVRLVEINMQRRNRQMVIVVKRIRQPLRQLPPAMIINVDQRHEATLVRRGFPGGLLETDAGEVANGLGATGSAGR